MTPDFPPPPVNTIGEQQSGVRPASAGFGLGKKKKVDR